MPAIPESYIGPSLRWSIYKETHPRADFSWKVCKGTEIGIPDSFGGDADIVIVTIDPRDGTDTHEGWVDVPADGTRENGVVFQRSPDALNMLITKALGRACKRAGLPDDSDDLRTALLFQQRQAEIRAIETGARLTPALPAAPVVPVQQHQIAQTSADPVPVSGQLVDAAEYTAANQAAPAAPVVSPPAPTGAAPHNDAIRRRVVALGADATAQFSAFLKERGIDLRASELEGLQLRVVSAYVDALQTKFYPTPTVGEFDQLRREVEEILAGFTNEQLTRFLAWLTDQGITEVEGITTVALFSEAMDVLESIASDESVEDATLDVVEVFGGEFVQDDAPREYPPGEEPF